MCPVWLMCYDLTHILLHTEDIAIIQSEIHRVNTLVSEKQM